MDDIAKATLEPELHPDETLRWAGRPRPWALALAPVLGAAFSGLLAVGAGIAVISFIRSPKAEATLGLAVCLAFTAVSLAGLYYSMIMIEAARWTYYGITDRRILVLQFRPRRNVTSWTPRQITDVERNDRLDGRGDVVFRRVRKTHGDGDETVIAALTDVEDARRVELLVLELADGRFARHDRAWAR